MPTEHQEETAWNNSLSEDSGFEEAGPNDLMATILFTKTGSFTLLRALTFPRVPHKPVSLCLTPAAPSICVHT